jgi:peroxiredoxin Q/BCP
MQVTQGSKLPAFTMKDADGKSVKSSELKAPYVLYFYPKDDTPGCTKEACGIRDHWAAFKKAGLQVYGVSADDAASHQKFSAKYDLPHTLLTADTATLEKLGIWQEKNMYGRKYMGIVRDTFLVGKDGTVLKHYQKVKPEQHAEELLADFKTFA